MFLFLKKRQFFGQKNLKTDSKINRKHEFFKRKFRYLKEILEFVNSCSENAFWTLKNQKKPWILKTWKNAEFKTVRFPEIQFSENIKDFLIFPGFSYLNLIKFAEFL